MAQFKEIAKVDDIPAGQGAVVEIENTEVAIFNVKDDFYAIENTCTHRGGPLGEGRVEGEAVICPWHGAQFDINSGEVLEPPAPTGVGSYPTKVENGSVWVKL